jgi:hypothetical protein
VLHAPHAARGRRLDTPKLDHNKTSGGVTLIVADFEALCCSICGSFSLCPMFIIAPSYTEVKPQVVCEMCFHYN